MNRRHFTTALGPLTGEFTFPTYTESMYLLDADGNVLEDQRYGLIRKEDYPLPAEQDPDVIYVREAHRAPYLLRFVNIENDIVATQFAFDAGDTPAAFWCTVWTMENNMIGIAYDKRELKPGNISKYWVDRGHVLPGWYLFAPGEALDAIAQPDGGGADYRFLHR